ncbi:MAG TPA: hypothetical protein DFI00_13020 [Rhodospirillaceae bacterium]|nr:hypothetical protein [Alphaproteobacteria bacterium]OUT41567.1 MAG: hypothetical protein CBB62_04335 [Micavibrio sp. TMED2]HCI48208.1 hypothetical protein [Rhodospirillaceae bacterium]MAS46871.1 hypothetical protein [Alphaproteobacteria bacterium]MAX94966.1 hypothetical protein [Alphaproteobacteria bacterium]|tara:strand:- start:10153 stop:10731 length:579 start_codon:yes stop_codon:yes gene_type:complete
MSSKIHTRRHRSRFRQAGLTLTDTILALVIAGLTLGGVGILFLRGLTDTKTNVGYQQYIVMQKSVRELYSGQADYSGLTNTLVYNSGYVPSDIKADSIGEMRNTWGGLVNVAVNGGNTGRFDISFEEVPREACVRIVSYTGNQNGSTDGVDSITVTADGGDTVFDTFPTNMASVVAACDDSNEQNILTWTAY